MKNTLRLVVCLAFMLPGALSFAAKGIVTWTNPPQNAGKIKSSINGRDEEFTYNVKAGHTKNGYTPKVGDEVQFDTDGSHVARNIEKVVTRNPECTLAGPSGPVARGTSVTITYETFHAIRAVFDNGIGEVPVGSGSVNLLVNADVKVTLIVYDSAGRSESCSVAVFVN